MLKAQINLSHSLHNLLQLHKPFVTGDTTNHSSSSTYAPTIIRQYTSTKKPNATHARSTLRVSNIRAIASPLVTKATTLKGVITIQPAINSVLGDLKPGGLADNVSDLLAGSFSLELVSNDLDSSGKQKIVQANAKYDALDFHINMYTFKCNFDVPEDFGEIGAILVENEYNQKMFFKTIVLDNNITFTCESWIQSKSDVPGKRIFFANKSYLPSETPEALKPLRKEDLESLRGNDEGERKPYDRIYDYDVYDDLGAPDESLSLARPVLGGEEHPYPRRCRTGRPMSTTGTTKSRLHVVLTSRQGELDVKRKQ